MANRRTSTWQAHRGGRRLALVVGSVVAVTATTMSAGHAATGAATGSGKPVGRADDPVIQEFVRQVGAAAVDHQEALVRFRDWMQAQPGFGSSGYSGSVDDLEHTATVLRWFGPRTPLLAKIVDEGRRRGIKVSVQPRRWSPAKLHAAMSEVWRQAAAGSWGDFEVAGVKSTDRPVEGIVVLGRSRASAKRQPARQPSLPRSVLGVPVQVRTVSSSGLSTGRDNDFAPFDAGGYMIDGTGHSCSSGFAIKINGVKRITTARHCVANDYHARDNSNNKYGTGVVNSGNGGGRVLSASGAPLALDGPWNSDGYYKTVIGFADVAVNDSVCTGGGNSGEHCNLKVTDTDVQWSDGHGIFYAIDAVQQTSGRIAQIQGDSGGPVISLASTSSGQVRAAGMIQGYFYGIGKGSVCGGARDPNNTCSTDVVFSSMRTVVNSISGATLLTG